MMSENEVHIAQDDLQNWHEANRRYLTAALALLRYDLNRYAMLNDPANAEQPEQGIEEKEVLLNDLRLAADALPSPSALDALSGTFGLSEFERNILLLSAGVELDARFAEACRRAGGMPPTFSLALSLFPGAHWSALTPNAPLRRWRLIDLGSGETLTTSPLRIEEPVLHYLAGTPCMDERLSALTEEVDSFPLLTSSQADAVARVIAAWTGSQERAERLPAIRLLGKDGQSIRGVASEACRTLGMNLRSISIHSIPTPPADLEMFCRLWERDAAFHSLALLLDCSDFGSEEGHLLRTAGRLADELHGALLVSGEKTIPAQRRRIFSVEVAKPPVEEQQKLWAAALPEIGLNGHVERLTSRLTTQFDLSAGTITSLSEEVLRTEFNDDLQNDPDRLERALWNACRLSGRARLDDLAQRIDLAATWEELILPERQKGLLREIVLQARNRGTVYQKWGFSQTGERGLGISSLFAGPSGTGKTMAAEVLAGELNLDLYRIDLSAVISKYIGETEKNLRKIFDAADEVGALLLFDEADSLFGKRSEVKDSHDRHANIEVSYLLQRMESYRGIAVLTTNMKSALDAAFLRRIRFIIQFPFPDAESRAEIWRHVFPSTTPTQDLDPIRLAQLNVTGGHIKNIALGGAFLAAEAGQPVRMSHLLAAAKGELAKLEKNLPANEIKGWL